MIKIGFAVLSHDEPARLLRLVKTLTRMFDAPPIACHHNFDRCPLDTAPFPSNAAFVRPHINNRWGDISVLMSALKALGHLAEHGRPDWFFLLSGSDYPVRRAAEIRDDLSKTDCDAFLDYREIRFGAPPPGRPAAHGFARSDWVDEARRRYWPLRYWLPYLSLARLRSGRFPLAKAGFALEGKRILPILDRLGFYRPARIFGGDFWFHANRKSISRLLDPALAPLWRYYGTKSVPDESAFHTALCNMPELRIFDGNMRYADWTAGGPHPKWLGAVDVPRIAASGAHFARKFLPDGAAQDFIDRTVLGL